MIRRGAVVAVGDNDDGGVGGGGLLSAIDLEMKRVYRFRAWW